MPIAENGGKTTKSKCTMNAQVEEFLKKEQFKEQNKSKKRNI